MSRRGGLGRGLGALIATADPTADATADATVEQTAPDGDTSADVTTDPVEGPSDNAAATTPAAGASEQAPTRPAAPVVIAGGARLIELDPATVERNPRQPREIFDEEEIDQLATSLLDVGMLQPLVVRPFDGEPGRYELVAGERRLRAALIAGLALVPAIVRATEDANLLKEALVENIHRVQLNPLEEAAAFQQLLEDFGVTQEELANRLGRSRPAVSNTIRLLSLPPAVQRRVAAGLITAGHAKALLSIEGAQAQNRLADRVIAEGLSVRATEEAARFIIAEGADGAANGSRASRSGGSKPRVTVPGLIELQDDLSDALEARVRISMGARRGRITIEFVTVDDLERVVGVIADGLGGVATRGTTSDTGDGPSSIPPRPRLQFDDLDVDMDELRRATDLSDLTDLDD
jgi:ParB family transcriptional regulator, chromosome partitioning protein